MRRMTTITKLTKAFILAAAMGAAVTPPASLAADSGQIQGPDFQAWDLKFGLIGNEDPDWNQKAIENGTLDNRGASCKVISETTTFAYPLPPDPANSVTRLPARYGLTFEYTTTKPNVPYTVVVKYPPTPEGAQRTGNANGLLPGNTTGKTGRFCFYQWSNDIDAQTPGTRCYQVTIEGVSLPQICADVLNPNAQ